MGVASNNNYPNFPSPSADCPILALVFGFPPCKLRHWSLQMVLHHWKGAAAAG